MRTLYLSNMLLGETAILKYVAVRCPHSLVLWANDKQVWPLTTETESDNTAEAESIVLHCRVKQASDSKPSHVNSIMEITLLMNQSNHSTTDIFQVKLQPAHKFYKICIVDLSLGFGHIPSTHLLEDYSRILLSVTQYPNALWSSQDSLVSTLVYKCQHLALV